MANKVSNIILPDGTTVTVPAWASESTMEQVVNYMAATNKVDQKFLTLMKGLGSDVQGLQQSISELVQNVNKNTENVKEAKEEDVNLAKGITGVAKSVMKVSGFFGDTRAPLSGMVNAVGSAVDSVKNSTPAIRRVIGSTGELSEGLQFFGSALDVGIDAVLAYAGWNAAKLEQFAEAQSRIIDAGAIFYSSGEQFDMLYSSSLDAGVPYIIPIEADYLAPRSAF